MPIEVTQPGLATQVQDAGRSGYYHVGIPPCGALDQYSYRVANMLVGNPAGSAVLECCYMGPKLHFTEPAVVAVTGAQAMPRVNGTEHAAWESFPVNADDELDFGVFSAGARAYIAVAGGIDAPTALGSRSTYANGALGGIDGRSLQAGDELAIGSDGTVVPGRAVPDELQPSLAKEVEVRVVMGLYDQKLTANGRDTFLGTDWTLTPVADRVGFRYSGPRLETVDEEQPFGAGQDPSNIVDTPYPVGSIQVPGSVEPIVLHRDAVSGGGYMMIATVISGDLDLVGQSTPKTKTRFVPISFDDALTARKTYQDRIQRLTELLQ